MGTRGSSPQLNGRWGALGRLMEWLTLQRAAVILPLLALLGGSLLILSVLVEGGGSAAPHEGGHAALPTTQPTAPAAPTTAPTSKPVSLEATATPLPPTPTPVPIPSDELNILLLGTDHRPGDDPSWRTDTIIIVAIRPKTKSVGLLSIPRDLWVQIPGYGPGRINTADFIGESIYGPGGGPRLLEATLHENLGIPVHAYARIHFDGLVRIVDSLGGVTVEVDRYFDEVMDEGTPYASYFSLAPGKQRLDGPTALAYARSRKGSSDLDRCRRQQQLLLAIRDAALRPSVLPQIPGLIAALADTIETNLPVDKILSLVPLACQLDATSYRTQVLDGTMVSDWITPAGAMVLLPNTARIRQAWQELTTTPNPSTDNR